MAQFLETPPLASRYTEILLDIARDKGFDPADLLGSKACLLARKGPRTWDNHTLGEVSTGLILLLDDQFWGLLDKENVPTGSVRFACEIGTLCEDLGLALNKMFALFGLLAKGVTFQLIEDEDTASIVMDLPGVDDRYSEFLIEWWLWLWHFLAQWLVGAEVDRVKVTFPHPAIGSLDDYRRAFGPSCQFQQGAAKITFARKALSLRVIKTLADVEAMHEKVAVVLSAPEVQKSWRTIVKNALNAELVKTAELPTMAELAASYGVCEQTLRRRLADEDTTYRVLKAEVRALAATRVLAVGVKRWSDVAEKAGFSEVNGFSRFIRGTTGMTLAEYRRVHAREESEMQ